MTLKNPARQSAKGFTLIELLIVIGIIGILAGIVLVAVDPAKRLKQARDARRYSEVNALLNAVLNYTVDNRGTLPDSASLTATTAPLLIGSTGCLPSQMNTAGANCDAAAGGTIASCVSLSGLVDSYIAQIPLDPRGGKEGTNFTYSATATGYYIMRTTNGRIEVGSCNTEDAASTIKVKR